MIISAVAQRRLGGLEAGARQAIDLRLEQARGRVHPLGAQLKALSPLNVLDRGYAIVQARMDLS